MALYTVYSEEQRKGFWEEQDKIDRLFKSDAYAKEFEKEIWHTHAKPSLPYQKTIPKKVENGWQFKVTANGKSAVVTVKDSQNTEVVVVKAVAKLFNDDKPRTKRKV